MQDSNGAMKRFKMVHTTNKRNSRGTHCAASEYELHKSGCRDLCKPGMSHCERWNLEAANEADALSIWFDEEMLELGYDAADCRVMPCCKGA